MNQKPVPKGVSVPDVPAPWHLKGRGYILLYRFHPNDGREDPFLSEKMTGRYRGGRAALMVVDYEESDAGPYRELLFIPGRVEYGGRRGRPFTISRIFVSTWESVVNGRKNWGIPKDRADFDWNRTGRSEEEISVTEDGGPVFSARLKRCGLPFPVHTALMPFPLVQEVGNPPESALYTQFSGRGWGRLALVEDVQVNTELFPGLAARKPWLAIRVEPFRITFPTAERGPAAG